MTRNGEIMVRLSIDDTQAVGRTKRQYLLSCLILLLAEATPDAAYALSSPDDTIKPYIASNFLYDSNFLRVSDSTNPVAVTGKGDKSEFIKQIAAGFDMDWTVSRQHLLVRARANQNWFQNFNTLDYVGWDTQAQWNWQLTNNLNGEIGYANARELGSFAQLNGLVPNLQNNQRAFANADYLFHPNGKIKLGYFRTESEIVGGGRQYSSNVEDNGEVHLQYLSPNGSIWGVRIRGTDGRYPQRELTPGSTLDNAYTRMNYAGTWDWRPTVKSRVEGLVGYTEQHYKHFGVRDFSDVIAELNLSWEPSEKTQLELSGRRLIGQADTLFTSFMLTQGVWFNATWRTTPKFSLTLPLSYQQQEYLGSAGASGIGFENQKDYVSRVGTTLMYHPLESISIGPLVTYEKRESNDPIRSYTTFSTGANVKVDF